MEDNKLNKDSFDTDEEKKGIESLIDADDANDKEEARLLKKAEKQSKKEEKKAAKAEKSKNTETLEKTDISEESEILEDSEKPEKVRRISKRKRKRERNPNVNIVKELLNLIVYIGIVILLCYVVITFVGQRTTVHGQSMEPTLHEGDNLWIDKLVYRVSDPKRFDVIVFPYQGSDVYYIKRIIGLPGETVRIDQNGYIYINGEILDESYGLEQITPSMIGIAGQDIVLGEDEYFVLGDNRNNSRDSRWADVGNVHRDDIIGKAVFRLSPLNKIGLID